ncbi:hypothetical protein D3C86_1852100 [compost metagenome]
MRTTFEYLKCKYQFNSNVGLLVFNKTQAQYLHNAAKDVASQGGPEARGTSRLAKSHAMQLKILLGPQQILTTPILCPRTIGSACI